jgi:hypothetical protein
LDLFLFLLSRVIRFVIQNGGGRERAGGLDQRFW